MTTHFITVEIAPSSNPAALNTAIQTELNRHGEPLRWAIAAVQADGTVTVEAVVTCWP
jgi:hypothetical protein